MVLICAVSAGCDGAALAKVRGRVVYDSQPVGSGKIMFFPATGRMAYGNINADGTYKLTTFEPGDGAPVGTYRVAIESTRLGADRWDIVKSFDEEIKISHRPDTRFYVPGKVEWQVPQRYARPETSGLTARVESGVNEIIIEIPGEK
jgi:hypothetical protein